MEQAGPEERKLAAVVSGLTWPGGCVCSSHLASGLTCPGVHRSALFLLVAHSCSGEDTGGCSLTYFSVPGLSVRWRDCSSSGLGPQVPPGSPPGLQVRETVPRAAWGAAWLALTALSWPCPLILSCLHRVHGHVRLGPWVTVEQGCLPPGPQCYGIGAVGWVCLTRGGRGTNRCGGSCRWPCSWLSGAALCQPFSHYGR